MRRAGLLQQVALTFLRSGVMASLAHVPGVLNPADPPSRAVGAGLLAPGSAAVQMAWDRARVCHIVPAS
eukprot:gene3046-8867_t